MKIKIHVLKCGSISVFPSVPYGSEWKKYSKGFRRIELPVFAYLIEHPKGLFLIDTGLCSGIEKLLPAHLLHFYHPSVSDGQTVDCLLAALGFSPGDIDLVLLTHLDPDHVSGMKHLSGVKRVLVSEDEYFWSCRTVYSLRQPRNTWIQYPMEHFWYRGSPVGPVKWAYDVLGDETVTVVNVPGHTDGSGAVVVKNGEDFVLFTGDAAFCRQNWESGVVPFGFDEKRQLKSLNWINEMSKSEHCRALLSSHDALCTYKIIEL